MFENLYEEYIRNILGYPQQQNSIPNYSYIPASMQTANYVQSQVNSELEDCYPEIYKLVYPMIKKACSSNNQPVTRELVENLTDEIYFSIENDNNEINVNINLNNQVQKNAENRNIAKPETKTRIEQKASDLKENRSSRPINRGLRDLIKILLLREFINRPNFPGNRPPVGPPFPGRPPFPGGPGNNPRPPMMPRAYGNDFNDIYEKNI